AMARRSMNWRILLALFVCASMALAPALAEARAGSSSGGGSSSMGSRGVRTYEPNSAQPLSRSMTTPPPATATRPGLAPSPAYGGGSFFQRHPFLTGLAGGFIGSWLFGHMGYAADGTSGGSAMGLILQILIIGLLSYFSEELTRNASQGTQNIVANVELLKGDLSESWDEGDLQYATAYMRWRALDYVVRLGRSPGDPDYLVSGDPRSPVEAEEVWTFVRRPGGTWLLSAIQQV